MGPYPSKKSEKLPHEDDKSFVMAVATVTTLVCPKCGSGRVHPVKNPNVFDSVFERMGLLAYRCETCSRRFRDWLDWLGHSDD